MYAYQAACQRSDTELFALPVLRISSVAAFSGNRDALRRIAAREFQPDYEDRVPSRNCACFDFPFFINQSSDGAGFSDWRSGLLQRALQPVDAVAAALYDSGWAVCSGRRLDRVEPASVSPGHGAGAVCPADVLVLADAHLHRRATVSRAVPLSAANKSAGFRGAGLSRPLTFLPRSKSS